MQSLPLSTISTHKNRKCLDLVVNGCELLNWLNNRIAHRQQQHFKKKKKRTKMSKEVFDRFKPHVNIAGTALCDIDELTLKGPLTSGRGCLAGVVFSQTTNGNGGTTTATISRLPLFDKSTGQFVGFDFNDSDPGRAGVDLPVLIFPPLSTAAVGCGHVFGHKTGDIVAVIATLVQCRPLQWAMVGDCQGLAMEELKLECEGIEWGELN